VSDELDSDAWALSGGSEGDVAVASVVGFSCSDERAGEVAEVEGGTVNLPVGVSRYGRLAGCAIRRLACPATDFR
jgi:hypothetical protein